MQTKEGQMSPRTKTRLSKVQKTHIMEIVISFQSGNLTKDDLILRIATVLALDSFKGLSQEQVNDLEAILEAAGILWTDIPDLIALVKNRLRSFG